MALNLSLAFGSPPAGTEFPGTPKALGDLLAQYFNIIGGDNFIPMNFGPDEPTEDNRDKPWFKTDENGNAIGWFAWNGLEWSQQPDTVKRGPTAERPDGVDGLWFFDTDINCLLMFERAQWRTASGSPGDVKFVKAATLELALQKNPGWAEDVDARGRVIGAAGESETLTPREYGALVGAEEHELQIEEIPEHQHSVAWSAWAGQFQNGVQDPTIHPVVTSGATLTDSNPPTGTGGNSHNNMQPTIFYWALVKE